ncbi:LOW QUALITY PROTEIN: probable E3 ubiquitin-protein ligase MID2 [Argopecten irradians]|uniref:LOW QUALITY PROTEIN: probable E3 ubiquitin-protein ligase MID2 n=1 Tax=Argopecten irradians TaxID=31199 RepID=UPI00371F081C
MAEGGPNQESVPKDGTQTDSHLLECPICLEQLHQPKCLPCHHSLCQECLNTYIISEVSGRRDTATTFTCPVCRTLTYPVDKTENKEKWAGQFPIDKVAMELIQMKSSSTDVHYCMSCETKDKKVSAQFWCKTNKCLLCKSCKLNHHDIVHFNCDAIDIRTSTYFLPRTETNSKRCDKHRKKMAYYCVDHNVFGCSKCVTVCHRKCDDVTTTEDYCETLDKDSKLVERTTYMKEAADSLESLVKNFHQYLQSIADDKESALQSIDDMEERFIQRMREMKKEIKDDLIAKYKEESGNFKAASQKCERLKVAMQNTMESTVTAQQQNNHIGTIILYQRGQTELDAWKDLVKEMRMTNSAVSLKHEAEFDGTILNFGKIVVQKQQRQLTDVPGLTKPLSECELKEVRKVNIKMESDRSDCAACGVVITSDGLVVVGDYSNRKLKLINTDGDVVYELKVIGRPSDLCLVDNTTVAAAIGNSIHVVTVTPDKLTLSNVINIGKQCHGITYRNGEFIVSSGKEVYRVTKDGETQILHRGPNTIYALSHKHRTGNLFFPYFTCTPDSTVIGSLSTDNLHKDVLKVGIVNISYPYGVDVDGEGNVYVCGYGSDNVVQMSGDETNVREVLTTADGMHSPRAISVCGDKIVVTNISSEHCNYISLFQLISSV